MDEDKVLDEAGECLAGSGLRWSGLAGGSVAGTSRCGRPQQTRQEGGPAAQESPGHSGDRERGGRGGSRWDPGCNRDTGLRSGLAFDFFFVCFVLLVWFDLAFGSENNS